MERAHHPGDECFDGVWDKAGPVFLHLYLELHVLICDLLVLLYELETLLFGLHEDVVDLTLDNRFVLHDSFDGSFSFDAECLMLLLGVAEGLAECLVLAREHVQIFKYIITFILYMIYFTVIY